MGKVNNRLKAKKVDYFWFLCQEKSYNDGGGETGNQILIPTPGFLVIFSPGDERLIKNDQ